MTVSTTLPPRTLVVCHEPLGSASSTSQTLGSLFEGWPADRLQTIYGQTDGSDGPDARGNWCLTLRSVRGYRRLRSVIVKPQLARTLRASDGLPAANGPDRRHATIITRTVAIARAWAELMPYEISPALLNWVAKQEPQLIFSPLGSLRWTRLVRQLSAHLSIPIVPFFFDDWPSTFYCFSKLVRQPRRALVNNLNGVLRRSNLLCCISDSMAREYETRYSAPTATFMRCVPTDANTAVAPVRPGGTLRLMYVGGLHLQRGRILEMVGEALARLRHEGIEAVLTIYTPARDAQAWEQRLDRPGIVEIAGTLASDAVPGMLATADVLVHVESFDEETVRFTRLSLSTKLPEYLSTGRAILAIGPRSLSSIDYVRQSGSGLVVDEETPEAVMGAIRRLASDSGLARSLGDAAWRTAHARHDRHQQCERFRALLTQAAAVKHPSDSREVGEALGDVCASMH